MTFRRGAKVDDFARIAALIREQRALGVVIGHPLNRDGRTGPQARRVEKYAQALESALGETGLEVPVILWDEYLSTWQAEEAVAGAGRRSRVHRVGLDTAANFLRFWNTGAAVRLATGVLWGTILPFYFYSGDGRPFPLPAKKTLEIRRGFPLE
jgi:putative Holliday junction resolvase